MIIQMRFQISGGRYDDRPWPGPGISFEVPDWEGQGLVKDGAAIFVSGSAVRAPAKKAAESVGELAKKADEPAGEPVRAVTESATATAVTEPTTATGQSVSTVATGQSSAAPAPADPKAAWVSHAVNRGADRADAEAMTKSQLQATFGGRL